MRNSAKILSEWERKMLEKEYKFLLTREQYDALKEYFQWNNTFEQFNYYYNDMDNYIYNNNITVRIRERNGKFKLQTKMNVYNNGALAIKEEKELDVDGAYALIQPEILKNMIGYMCRDIHKVGVLKTYRDVCTKFQNVEICLDMNEYLSIVDYELEIEYTSENGVDSMLRQMVKKFGLQLEKKTEGKNSRFFHELKHFC